MCVLFCQESLILTDPSWRVFQNEEKSFKGIIFSVMGGKFLGEVQVGEGSDSSEFQNMSLFQ